MTELDSARKNLLGKATLAAQVSFMGLSEEEMDLFNRGNELDEQLRREIAEKNGRLTPEQENALTKEIEKSIPGFNSVTKKIADRFLGNLHTSDHASTN